MDFELGAPVSVDYKKKYEEALNRAKESLKDGGISQNSIDYIQSIFPELKESEDEEMIREKIVLALRSGELVERYKCLTK